MARIIAVTSGKGGVGKTTVSANLGIGLAGLHKKVVIVDMDLGLRNLDVALGLETKVFYHLGDVLSGRVRVEEALVTSPDYPYLYLLAAPQNLQSGLITEEAFRRLLTDLDKKCDFVLLDCPAGIGENFMHPIRMADEGLVVTSPVVSAVRDADKVLHLLEQVGVRRRYVLINDVRYELLMRGAMMNPKDISEVLGTELIGVIPDDDEVIECCNAGKPVEGTHSPAGEAFTRISRRLNGETLEIPTGRKLFHRKKGLFRH